MYAYLQLIPVLLDPRGRCNRRGLLLLAGVMLLLEIVLGLAVWGFGFSLHGPLASAVKLLLFWVAICACSKRLHDLGLGAGMLGWGLVATIVWVFTVALAVAFGLGMEHLLPAGRWFPAAMAACMLPVIGALLWLHLAKGDETGNAYGPPPSGLGYSVLEHRRTASHPA